MYQNSAPPGDELISQDIHAIDYAMDHLPYGGGDSDNFAGEDGHSCEVDYCSEVDVSGSNNRAADYTDEPEPPNPTHVAGQTTLFQSSGSRGIKPASRAHLLERYGKIEEQRICQRGEENQAHPERVKST